MAPSAPATARMSATGDSAASFVAGGSPKVPSSRKAAAPRARRVAVSSGPGGTGRAGTVAAVVGVRNGAASAVRVASEPGDPGGPRRTVAAARSRSSITRTSETMPVRVLSSDCARLAASSAPERSSSVSRRRASAKFAS